MPNPVDVVTNQVRGFITAAMAEAVAAERTAARAAELERVRQVANKLLEEDPFTDPALRNVAGRAFDELFRRLAVSGDEFTAPLPSVLNRPETGERAFDRDFRKSLDDRGPLGVPSAAFDTSDPRLSHQRLAEVHGGEPGGPYEDNSPEAIGERARLELERREQEAAKEAERQEQKATAKADKAKK